MVHVSMAVGHDCESRKKDWTGRDAVWWVLTSFGPVNYVSDVVLMLPQDGELFTCVQPISAPWFSFDFEIKF